MRFGNWRGVTLATALVCATLTGSGQTARATDLLGGLHTIPRETLAKDYRTGDVYYAPPIPYGHYAKNDYDSALIGASAGAHGLISKICGACNGLGRGCRVCGGQGGFQGPACGSCGGQGCGTCGGLGIGGHGLGGHGLGIGGHGLLHGKGLFKGHGHHKGAPMIYASSQAAPSPQIVCGGCGGKGCGLCGGLGKGLFHHGKGGDLCGSCGGTGCGRCGGKGLFHHGRSGGDVCGSCGGQGCGACGGSGSRVHSLLGRAHGMVQQAGYRLGVGGVEYFVGPGGPVPITPGYVPYVVPTRSPRDYFAFPPFVDRAF